MSIMIGIKTNEQIILASDKRKVLGDGTYTDNYSKLFAVNDHLAFSGAGNVVFAMNVFDIIEKSENKQNMITDDLIEITKRAYNLTRATCALKKSFDKDFIDTASSSCCFIAGLNKHSENKLIFAYDEGEKGDLIYKEKPYMIAPPEDMAFNECFDIFEKNLYEYPLDFMERTIKYIATKSIKISLIGNKWVYDVKLKKGKLTTF